MSVNWLRSNYSRGPSGIREEHLRRLISEASKANVEIAMEIEMENLENPTGVRWWR